MIISLNDLIFFLSIMTILLNIVAELFNTKYDFYLAVDQKKLKNVTNMISYLFFLSMIIRVWISYTTI